LAVAVGSSRNLDGWQRRPAAAVTAEASGVVDPDKVGSERPEVAVVPVDGVVVGAVGDPAVDDPPPLQPTSNRPAAAVTADRARLTGLSVGVAAAEDSSESQI
jgi:hypothetical protein